MSRFKKITLAVLAVCLAVCAGIAITACDQGGIRNPGDTDDKNAYTVTLVSQGGLPISGVAVSLASNGETMTDKILSDENGKSVFEVKNLIDYDMVLDSSTIPAGYAVMSGATAKITAATKAATIRFSSSVISDSAPAGTSYKIGDVIHNFRFVEAETGTIYDLAETLSEKKAVMLNFWGTSCPPCRAEFPAIQEAYNAYSDKIEIFALSSYLQADTTASIAKFKTDGEYTFPMGLDWGSGTSQVYTRFNVSSYPTTIIVDRYGVIAYRSSGGDNSSASWKALFERFTKDDYSQDTEVDLGGDDQTSIVLVDRPESVTHPDSATIAAAINGSSVADKVQGYYFNDDYADDWFWDVVTVDGNSVLRPNNYATDCAYGEVTFKINLKPGEGLQFDYYTNTLSDVNTLYVFIDGKIVTEFVNSSNGWQTCRDTEDGPLYIATRTITLEVSFLYFKTAKVVVDTPVYIDNISVYDATQTGDTRDLAFSPVEGLEVDSNGHYDINIELGDDGVYYYTYENNSGNTERVMLFVDVTGLTYWAERHLNDTRFTVNYSDTTLTPSVYFSSMYNVAYWYWDKGFTFEGTSYTNSLYTTYYLQAFSESGYAPVTQSVQELLYAFTKYAYTANYATGSGNGNEEYTLTEITFKDEWYEDQWLELCYYFMHFGPEHAHEEDCYKNMNTSMGLTFELAYEAQLGENEVDITKILNLSFDEFEAGGGVKYKFTPEESGIYLIYSTHESTDNDLDEDGNYIGVDPAVRIVNLDTKTLIEDNNDDNRRGYLDSANFFVYVEMKAGVTYGITACMNFYQNTGKYTFNIEKSSEDHIAVLMSCTYSNAETWYVDEDGNPTDADGNPLGENDPYVYYFMAVKPAYNPDTGYYYEYLEGGNFGSLIYIDFVGPNHQYTSGASLYDAILGYDVYKVDDNGDLIEDEDGNYVIDHHVDPLGEYTDKFMEYYEKSIANKDKDDVLYGLIAADAELVSMIAAVQGETVASRYWERFAYYYVEYFTPAD